MVIHITSILALLGCSTFWGEHPREEVDRRSSSLASGENLVSYSRLLGKEHRIRGEGGLDSIPSPAQRAFVGAVAFVRMLGCFECPFPTVAGAVVIVAAMYHVFRDVSAGEKRPI